MKRILAMVTVTLIVALFGGCRAFEVVEFSKEPNSSEQEVTITEQEPSSSEREVTTTEQEPSSSEREATTTEKEATTTKQNPKSTTEEESTTEHYVGPDYGFQYGFDIDGGEGIGFGLGGFNIVTF